MVKQRDIEYLAKLSLLEISEQDMTKVKSDLEHILDFVQVICDYDSDGISQSEQEASMCRLREDMMKPSCSRDEMLSNAPLHKDGYIVLRKSE